MSDPIRIPLVEEIEPRLADSDKDSLASNVFYDKGKNGTIYASKRPGITSYSSAQALALGIYGPFRFTSPNWVWGDISCDGDKFCAVTLNNQNETVDYPKLSAVGNGTTWDYGSLLVGDATYRASGVAGNGSYFIACGHNDTTTRKIKRSTDGVTWSDVVVPDIIGYRVAVNGSNFVVVGNTGATVQSIYSTDNGASWTAGNLPSDNWTEVAYCSGAGLFATVCSLAGGITDRLYTSPTGASWTNRTPNTDTRFTICASPTRFVTPTYQTNRGYTSTNGTTWTQVNFPVSANWLYSCWTGTQFLISGYNYDSTPTYYIISSTDGLTWSVLTSFPYAGLSLQELCGNESTIIILATYSSGLSYIKMDSLGANAKYLTFDCLAPIVEEV